MPVSPDYARELVQGIRDVYEDATTKIIAAIAEQVAQGIQDEGRADRRLESFLRLIQRIDLIIDELRRGVPGAVERAIAIAYRRGSAVATKDADDAGLPDATAGAVASVGRTDAISRLLSEAMRPHEEAILQIRRQAQDAYERAVSDAVARMLTGSGTRFEAARDAVLDLMRSGIVSFTDKSGRKWDLASYVEMATRTSAGNAMVSGHVDRLVDLDQDIVIVSNAPEECKLCFIPGTTVEGPIPTGATRSEYTGNVVRITTASGNDLTGTPDHPVLTARGWVALKHLRPGDQVVSHSREQGYPGVVPDDIQMPARIEEVGESGLPVLFAGPARSDLDQNVSYRKVSGPAVDLHLASKVDAALGQPIADLNLIDGVGAAGGRFGLGGSDLHGLRSRNASVGLMHGVEHGGAVGGGSVLPPLEHSLSGESRPLLMSQFGHASDDSVRLGTSLDASAAQVVADNAATDAESCPECLSALSGDVSTDEFARLGIAEGAEPSRPGGCVDAAVGEDSFESGLADVEGGHELFRRLAGSVSLDEVVDVTVSEYSGHVWDLSTVPRWFVANSIVVHNCRPFEGKVLSISGGTTGRLSDGTVVEASLAEARRAGLHHPNCRHSLSAFLPGVTEAPTRTADPDGDKLRQRQRAYERRIREWKRRVAMDESTLGKDDPRTKADRKRLRTAQAEFRQWREAHGRKNLSRRTNITVR